MAYWEDRIAKSQSNVYKKTKKEIDEQLSKYYAATAKQVIEDFENTYLKLLDDIGKDKEPTPADLYKLDKYWKLQAQLRKELQKLGEKEIALLTKQFENEFYNVYDELALEGLSQFNSLDTDSVSQIINQVWCADRKSWSERIWENTELLAETLNEQLIHTVASGRKTSDLKKLLQERFKVSYSRADSVVRTELAHIQTEAAKKRYQDYGIKEVEVLADEDERRCDICGKLHGKRFPIDANIPIPAHPCCRCCIVPVVEDNMYKDEKHITNISNHNNLTNEKNNSNITKEHTIENMTNQDWSQATFSSEERAEAHKKHLKEYGDITFEEYVQGARELLSTPLSDTIDGFISDTGSLYKYDIDNNDMVIGNISPEGIVYIITRYKPRTKKKYWDNQKVKRKRSN